MSTQPPQFESKVNSVDKLLRNAVIATLASVALVQGVQAAVEHIPEISVVNVDRIQESITGEPASNVDK